MGVVSFRGVTASSSSSDDAEVASLESPPPRVPPPRGGLRPLPREPPEAACGRSCAGIWVSFPVGFGGDFFFWIMSSEDDSLSLALRYSSSNGSERFNATTDTFTTQFKAHGMNQTEAQKEHSSFSRNLICF